MQLKSRAGFVAVFIAIFCLSASAQDAPAPAPETRGVPPRATPADYQAHASAGTVTIGAEFTGHSIATPDALLSTEDYVVVEVGLFGPPQARIKLSNEDFSLRINGKKTPLSAEPYGAVFRSLKDPAWEPPDQAPAKSKTSIGTGGNGDSSSLPPIVHIPIELKRSMQLRVQKAALPEGDRVLPEAGLLFFEHGGKVTGIHSMELIYAGPAGKATLELNP